MNYKNIIQIDGTPITNEEMITLRQSDASHYEGLIKNKHTSEICKRDFKLKLSSIREEIAHRVSKNIDNPSAYGACDVCGNSYEECECSVN